MCGIFGAVSWSANFSEHRLSTFHSAIQTLRSRGPDNISYYYGEKYYFGHTRLAIQDLRDVANQPMHSKCGRYMLVYNGEIYNYTDLLPLIGSYQLLTHSDTELLLALSIVDPKFSFLSKIDGMFAFGFYDFQTSELVLARDRFGEKPLFYRSSPDYLIFGSTVKSIIEAEGGNLNIDKLSVIDFFNFGFFVGGSTIFEGVESLEPGVLLRIDSKSGISRKFYWTHTTSNVRSVRLTTLEFLSTFLESVRVRLPSDVSSALMLSGGVDSSLIAGSLRKAGVVIPSFTLGVKERDLDETGEAEMISIYCQLPNCQIQFENNFFEIVNEHFRAFDQPFGDSSSLNFLLIAKNISKHHKVALTGDGGDEFFLGYMRFYYFPILWYIRKNIILGFAARSLIFISLLLSSLFGSKLKNLYKLKKFFSSNDIEHAYRIFINPGFNKYYDEYRPLNLNAKSPFEFIKTFERDQYLVNDLLVKSDRASMAYGLEVRTPFLNTKITEAFQANLVDYFFGPKSFLKAARKILFPKIVFSSKKKGFSSRPPNEFYLWLKKRIDVYSDYRLFDLVDIYDRDEFLNLIEMHLSGRENLQHQIWYGFIFYEWLYRFEIEK